MKINIALSLVFSYLLIACVSNGLLVYYQNDQIRAQTNLIKKEIRKVAENDKKTFSIGADKLTYIYADIEFTNL